MHKSTFEAGPPAFSLSLTGLTLITTFTLSCYLPGLALNEALSDVTEARTDWLFLLLFFPDLDTVLRPVIGDANLGDAPLGDVLLGDALELASP